MNCLRADYENPKGNADPNLRMVTAERPVRRSKSRKKSPLGGVEKFLFAAAAAGLIWYTGTSAVDGVRAISDTPKISTATLTVQPGDTLWKIAGRINLADEQQADKVSYIRSLNPSLNANGQLTIGEKLVIPAKSSVAGDPDLHLAKVDTPERPSM